MINYPEFKDPGKMVSLLRLIDEKEELVRLLNDDLRAEGIDLLHDAKEMAVLGFAEVLARAQADAGLEHPFELSFLVESRPSIPQVEE